MESKQEVAKGTLSAFLNEIEKAEEACIGIENDEEFESDNEILEEEPFDVKNIRVTQKMITIYQVEHWIQSEILNMTPDYQRHLVWNAQRKSALIESLMLSIPIPSFYMDENKKGYKNIIDGMQRITTIHDFLNDRFPLKKMQYLSRFNGAVFSELDINYRSRIEDTTLAINILDERCPEIVKFDVFRRVNTGGVPLNPQEIRNIMATAEVRRLLSDMTECIEFLNATRRKVNDIRMGAQELCLRYIAIRLSYQWNERDFKEYHGLLRMMDETILFLNKMSDVEKTAILMDFKQTMTLCADILGDMSFAKPNNNKINKSLFTSWAVVLSNMGVERVLTENCLEDVVRRYQSVLDKNHDFYSAITSSTGTRKNILLSIDTIRRVVEDR